MAKSNYSNMLVPNISHFFNQCFLFTIVDQKQVSRNLKVEYFLTHFARTFVVFKMLDQKQVGRTFDSICANICS